MQDEAVLVQRAQRNDHDAFAQLYEAYFDKIYRYIVFKISNAIEAEDMTQQVFLKALRSISSFKWKGASFSSWLYRIAHNQVVDHYRKQAKRVTIPIEDAPVIADTENDPEEMVEHKMNMERVLKATKELTESQREVVSLRFTSEFSIAEVAKLMGKSQGAIKALQHSAVAALRRQMLVEEQ